MFPYNFTLNCHVILYLLNIYYLEGAVLSEQQTKISKWIANSLKGGLTCDVLERRNSCRNHRPDWSTEGMSKMVQSPETVENVLAIGQIQRRNE